MGKEVNRFDTYNKYPDVPREVIDDIFDRSGHIISCGRKHVRIVNESSIYLKIELWRMSQ